MLELYEAAHFQLHGENILEEALSFTTFHLKLAESTVDYPLSTPIATALKRPLSQELAEMKRQCQAFSVEAKWLHENYIPTMEEYMPIALVSCGYLHLTISSFVGMEDNITKETFNWAFNDPKIIRASSSICSLMSDIVEKERGHVSSAVECHMKQYRVSMEEAYDVLYEQINNAWKDINEEFLKPTAAPTSALNRILNLARVIDLLYKGEDAYTQVGESAKTSITALLIDRKLIKIYSYLFN
ncbi:probable terpene synthase 2 [Gossypium arboreum]|uniref:probable terpene synthase 2 n=1 Tax=Gossypium arboreum TaxID=29729 RepID=UPI0022F1C0F2|nr:probable terpene synthase 2 [Gossypium arboreum]